MEIKNNIGKMCFIVSDTEKGRLFYRIVCTFTSFHVLMVGFECIKIVSKFILVIMIFENFIKSCYSSKHSCNEMRSF